MASSDTSSSGSTPVAPAAPSDALAALLAVRRLLGSVRFGIVLLALLLACCMLGMVIMQQGMAGFEEYYAELTPAQQTVYGKLGLFDVYGSWYFAALLLVTGLNIVVSSVDRFPGAWRYLRRPKVEVSKNYLRAQPAGRVIEAPGSQTEVVGRVSAAFRMKGLAPRVTERGGRVTVFAERHAWNRMGAYVVHVALLAIFAGGFLTSQLAVSGVLTVEPGSSSNVFVSFDQGLGKRTARELKLPFRVECTDIQQQLIDPAGGLDPSNTLDWLSRVRVADESGTTDALIRLNEPLDHRGYRFFQSSFEPEGSARAVTLTLESQRTGVTREVALTRGQPAEVPGLGRLELTGFFPDFQLANGKPATRSGEYNNPVAQLRVTGADGKARQAFALGADLAEALRSSAQGHGSAFAVGDYLVTLESYEKVARSHMLRVQYDPGKNLVYFGFALLIASLAVVFAFSHERYWAVVEPSASGATVTAGANTNRNPAALRARFAALADSIETAGTQS